MRRFTELYLGLDRSRSSQDRIAALAAYFTDAPKQDASAAIGLLLEHQRKRIVSRALLRNLAEELSSVPSWLFDASLSQTGDLTETVALLTGQLVEHDDVPLHIVTGEWLRALESAGQESQAGLLMDSWSRLSANECPVWNKIATGGFRTSVTRTELAEALSRCFGVSAGLIAQRLQAYGHPSEASFLALLTSEGDELRPYPFHLGHPVQAELVSLQRAVGWQAEWYWSGLRAQLVKRNGKLLLWTRASEVVTDIFPEIVRAAQELPDGTVLDGQLVAWRDGAPLPRAFLERRLLRKPTSRTQHELPVVFLAYDLLELGGEDIRSVPLRLRRERLEEIVGLVTPTAPILLSPVLDSATFEALEHARTSPEVRSHQGIVLKDPDAPYAEQRHESWKKWKKEPHVVDAVLMYAERGDSGEFEMYSFGVWHREELVPVAKLAIELSSDEKEDLDNWIRQHTLERFGPVRTVAAEQVFGLAFEDIEESSRHKSGVLLRGVKVTEWKREKSAVNGATLRDLTNLLR